MSRRIEVDPCEKCGGRMAAQNHGKTRKFSCSAGCGHCYSVYIATGERLPMRRHYPKCPLCAARGKRQSAYHGDLLLVCTFDCNHKYLVNPETFKITSVIQIAQTKNLIKKSQRKARQKAKEKVLEMTKVPLEVQDIFEEAKKDYSLILRDRAEDRIERARDFDPLFDQ